ncbi:MAG: hypothetical protein HYZ75_12100 [Elusimicrobia bacterium]|nr:hypothetical protein [Elusimicrobiota bacterium]
MEAETRRAHAQALARWLADPRTEPEEDPSLERITRLLAAELDPRRSGSRRERAHAGPAALDGISALLARQREAGTPEDRTVLGRKEVARGLLEAVRGCAPGRASEELDPGERADREAAERAAVLLAANGLETDELAVYAVLRESASDLERGEAARAVLASLNERIVLQAATRRLREGGDAAFQAAEDIAVFGYYDDPRLGSARDAVVPALKARWREQGFVFRAGSALARIQDDAEDYEAGPSAMTVAPPPLTLSDRAELWRQNTYLPALRGTRDAVCAAPGKCRDGAVAAFEWSAERAEGAGAWSSRRAREGAEGARDAVCAVGAVCRRKMAEAAGAALEPARRRVRESLMRVLPVPQ